MFHQCHMTGINFADWNVGLSKTQILKNLILNFKNFKFICFNFPYRFFLTFHQKVGYAGYLTRSIFHSFLCLHPLSYAKISLYIIILVLRLTMLISFKDFFPWSTFWGKKAFNENRNFQKKQNLRTIPNKTKLFYGFRY